MPQSEMEALMQLQKETIKSLRHLVDSQRLTIEQMAKSYEEQTAQMNQTIANLNETVEYLKKKLFASSSEKTKKDGFPGQMDLFNEAEAAGLLLSWSRLWRRLLAVINVRQRNRRLPEKRSLQGFLWSKFPAPCRRRTGTAPTAMPRGRPSEKRSCGKNCGSSPQKWNGSSISRKCLAVRNVRKTALPLSLGLKHQAHC